MSEVWDGVVEGCRKRDGGGLWGLRGVLFG